MDELNANQSMKALAAIVISTVGAIIVALSGFGSDASIADLDWETWLIAILTILGSGGIVWYVENVKGVAGTVIKAVVGFLTAGIASLVVAIDDGLITQAEWLVALSAAALATGFVYQLPGPRPSEPTVAEPVIPVGTTKAVRPAKETTGPGG